jgi:hypothetical protein
MILVVGPMERGNNRPMHYVIAAIIGLVGGVAADFSASAAASSWSPPWFIS